MIPKHSILPGLTVLTLAAASNAAIIGVTGATTWLGSPPAACGPFQLFSANAFAWDEQQGVNLTVACDMINNPGNSGSPSPGTIAGLFDSHFIHFDGSTGVSNAIGTVTFNGPIIGVIFNPLTLDNSDLAAGAFGTVYPTGYPFRGINTSLPSFCSILGNTISFNLNAFATVGEIAQIRVLTHSTPAPGSMAVLAMAGLTCGRRRRR